jgi:hypothetical protein
MTRGPRWRRGTNDVLPLGIFATPALIWALFAGSRAFLELALVVAAVATGLALKHLLPTEFDDVAILPPTLALLLELGTIPLTVIGIFLAATAGVGLLLWAGAEPDSGLSVRQQLEPSIVPALGAGVAGAVLFFLPRGSGGQVGVAALILVVVLGLSAWLYLRSAAEVTQVPPSA